jgi:hypothetical protein
MRSRGRSWILAGAMAVSTGVGCSLVAVAPPAGATHPLAGKYELFWTITSPSPASYTCTLVLNSDGATKILASTACGPVTKGRWSVTGTAVTIKLYHDEDIFTGKITAGGFNNSFHQGTYSQTDPNAQGTWYAKYQS